MYHPSLITPTMVHKYNNNHSINYTNVTTIPHQYHNSNKREIHPIITKAKYNNPNNQIY
jgi:hypothetical protein